MCMQEKRGQSEVLRPNGAIHRNLSAQNSLWPLFSRSGRWPLHWWDGVRIWLILLACSLASEAAQAFVPDRNGNWLDVRDDLIGAAIGIVVGMALRAVWARSSERRAGV